MKAKCPAAPSLNFSNISVTFGRRQLFSGLSFDITAGRCTCLLGPSGCGKSTILRLAAGAAPIPFSGEIRYSINNCKIGWMGQNDLLLPWLNLRDNILLGPKLRGEDISALTSKANMLLNLAGLSGYADMLPGTLSGGMRQRGALLRTLMEDAQIVLMDEPFSALDALTRMNLQDLAVNMTKERTVLLVTHDPLEALRMAHEILVFSSEPDSLTRFIDLPGTPPRPAGCQECASIYQEILALLLEKQS